MERIERKISKSGTITVPSNLRRQLGIEAREKIELSVTDDGKIIVERTIGHCIFCGSDQELSKMKKHYICKECLSEVYKLRGGDM
ncbi:MAG: AbrB/MazE/SpoVT family DNA-binding domain-containing protein [Filifactoraceae bacterium]